MRRLAAAWCVALGLGASWGWLAGEPRPRLTFLAVGQGDCAVFQAAGTAMLFDVGPKSEVMDAGERIVLPDLRKIGVDSVSLIVLSHPDTDHIGGLAAVLRRYPEARVAASAAFRSHAGFLQALHTAGREPGELIWLDREARVQLDGFTLSLSCPPWTPGTNDNDGSVFVRIAGQGASAVLSGDASQATEDAEIADHDWSAQVLKAGHHGSKSASGQPWLRAVHPIYAVVSCGRGNLYGHPHTEALDRLRAAGAKIMRTDLGGDIAFEVGPKGFEPIDP